MKFMLDRIVAEKTSAAQERLAQGKQVAGQRLWPTGEAIEWAKKALTFESAAVEVRPVWERCLCHGSYTCSSLL
jgi:hypothetical protein